MAIDYLPHLAFRQGIYLFWAVMQTYVMNQKDENTILTAVIALVLLDLGVESIIYVNHKAKVELFMRIKVTEFQQEQLMDLFDTVPDKVLIFSKTSEASAPKSLYSNR